ncbi:hypothetical protein GCM10011487_13150 [Steroidobacter agaridevorans]|uniref:Uncharacterized protein n=1 Tax=Steroidobacter agaridevorans TaxID=2695856 RepID=A0A829Y8J3_9GAMM|nr:hypothetical protein [Steroidobacter agaridevorans]GFE79315.1 hypothetical protein GCM10011487_13150 [Steroidobacter agaridevorans]GFE88320.1 hypothetical protein GCM10011488_32740 [Steroidobacter agaridevorans]
MVDVLLRWATLFGIAAFALPAWACFPAPGAKPTHAISVVELPRAAIGIGVVLQSEGYAVRVLANDLASLLSKEQVSIASPNDLSKAVRSKMALGEDFDTRHLPALSSDPETQRWAAKQAILKLRYAFASLLEQGKASVTDLSSHRDLSQIKLDRYTDICSRGRSFKTPDGKVVLHVVDAIS